MRALLPSYADDVDLHAAYAVPSGRHVRVNFACSADGAVTVAGRSAGLSSRADRSLFHLLRTMADVVLVGAGTVRAENYGGAKEPADAPPPIAVVTRSLDLDVSSRLFTDTRVRPIIVTCERAPADRRAVLAEHADVVVAGDDDVDGAAAIEGLASRGLEHVLCEGGPQLFGSLLAAGVVDELCLTVAPLAVGGHAGRIVAGFLPQVPTALTIGHALEEDGHLFLRYVVAR